MDASSPSNNELHEAAVAYRVEADDELLELPVNRDFNSPPPRLTPTEYVAWCEECLGLAQSKVFKLQDSPKLRPVFSL